MTAAHYLQVFLPMLWLGMVLAISFLEAPLKFRAPGITIALGLGIGRLVFRALNTVEVVIALVLLAMCLVADPGTAAWGVYAGAAAVLAIQVAVVRPPLTRRSNAVLAGEIDPENSPRSYGHFVYVGFELVKVGLLIALAILLAQAVGL